MNRETSLPRRRARRGYFRLSITDGTSTPKSSRQQISSGSRSSELVTIAMPFGVLGSDPVWEVAELTEKLFQVVLENELSSNSWGLRLSVR